jgi:hypothetical protein
MGGHVTKPKRTTTKPVVDEAAVLPSDAPEPELMATEPDPAPPPAFAAPDEAADAAVETVPDEGGEPLPREYVTLVSNASYGPVIIGGRRTQTVRNRLYYVPDAEERADILGTGRFRAATVGDLERAGSPSAGPGGAITRDMLPPGAIKGGLNRR